MAEALTDEMNPVEALEERMKELEKELEKLQPKAVEEDEEHSPADFSDMYDTLRKSGAIKGIDMPTPATFTGEELKKNPYALHRWYKEVSCWVKARVAKDVPQAAMALQTLGGTAKLAMENMEATNPGKLKSLDAILQALLHIFQRCDPGPKAYDEFLRTRMRTDETAVEFLNRLLSLSVVINSSKDPTVIHISDSELATRFRAGLPGWIVRHLREKHQLLVSLNQTPDTSSWGLAGTVMEIEQNNPQHQGQPSKVNQASYRGRANAIVENRPAFPSDSKFQRSPKRFVDLEEEDKTNIAALQQELQPYELKAKLPLALFKRCRQLMVCESCHRYGHVGRNCKSHTTFSSKN